MQVTLVICLFYLRRIGWLRKFFWWFEKINKQSVQECFFSKHWENDEDCVKIAVLFFIELFLFSSPTDKLVSRKIFNIVESNLYNEYLWGKDVFDMSFECLKGRLTNKEKKLHDGFFYRLNGFLYVLQVWFYECCPFLSGNICFFNGGKIPRILSWHYNSTPSYKVLMRTVFSELAKKVLLLLFFLLLIV